MPPPASRASDGPDRKSWDRIRDDPMTTYPAVPATLVFLRGAPSAVHPPRFRTGERLNAKLPKTAPDTGRPLNLLPCPFSSILFGSGEAGAEPASVLLSGEQYVVKPGDGAILVVMLVRRKSHLTHQAFRERWLFGHARFGLRIAASGYRQLHPHKEPDPDGFDGAGLVFFRDIDHTTSARAAPEIARDATLDEMAFIDHERSMLAMFQLNAATDPCLPV